jgi:hypothetical protein
VRTVLLTTRPIDVDPSAAATVDAAFRQVMAARGMLEVPGAHSALYQLGVEYPRNPGEVWHVASATGARLGIYATVRAQRGQYVVFVTVADANGTGPYLTERTSDADGLAAAARAALDEALSRAGFSGPSQVAPTPTFPDDFAPWQLGIGTRGAIGLTKPTFYNQLAGFALRRRFSRELGLGFALSYANLKGPSGRTSNVLPEVVVDYRVHLTRSTWRLPIRAAAGYLPKNGPTLQIGAGIGARVSDTVELAFDLVAPMLWLSDNLTVASMVLGVEVGIDL